MPTTLNHKAYIINAASETNRWQAIFAQIDFLNMPVERIEAVMGKVLSVEELSVWYSPTKNTRHFHKPLLLGEIGCYASHITAWRKILTDQLDWALIIEDDAILSPDIGVMLETLTARVDFNVVDMVKLRGRAEEQSTRKWRVSDGLELVAYERIPSCTTGYILTAHGARKLLAHNPPVASPSPVDIDICNWWLFDLHVVGAQPYPIKSNHEYASMIGSRPSKGILQQLKRLWQHKRNKIQRRRALRHQTWLNDVLL